MKTMQLNYHNALVSGDILIVAWKAVNIKGFLFSETFVDLIYTSIAPTNCIIHSYIYVRRLNNICIDYCKCCFQNVFICILCLNEKFMICFYFIFLPVWKSTKLLFPFYFFPYSVKTTYGFIRYFPTRRFIREIFNEAWELTPSNNLRSEEYSQKRKTGPALYWTIIQRITN